MLVNNVKPQNVTPPPPPTLTAKTILITYMKFRQRENDWIRYEIRTDRENLIINRERSLPVTHVTSLWRWRGPLSIKCLQARGRFPQTAGRLSEWRMRGRGRSSHAHTYYLAREPNQRPPPPHHRQTTLWWTRHSAIKPGLPTLWFAVFIHHTPANSSISQNLINYGPS